MIRVVHPGSRIHNTDFKGCRCTIHVGSLTTSLLLIEENTSDPTQSRVADLYPLDTDSAFTKNFGSGFRMTFLTRKYLKSSMILISCPSILSCCKLTIIVVLIKKKISEDFNWPFSQLNCSLTTGPDPGAERGSGSKHDLISSSWQYKSVKVMQVMLLFSCWTGPDADSALSSSLWPLWSPHLNFFIHFRSRAFSLTTLVLLANALLVLLSDFLTTFSGQAGFSESIATLPPFGPIEGYKWFDQISSQWESQKNRIAFISFGKIQFLPSCIWNPTSP
jgi:hypothetical protein